MVGDSMVNSSRPVRAIDLVCTSPLTRCLETAQLAFLLGCPLFPEETGAVELPQEAYKEEEAANEGAVSRRMSKAHAERECTRPRRKPLPMMHPRPPPPFYCSEDLRDIVSVKRYPTKRRQRSMLQAAFPQVNFTSLTEEDELWGSCQKESISDLTRRITSFFTWLSNRPEKNIAVVTHGAWIEECIRRSVPSTLKGGIRVKNADVYRCECVGNIREDGSLDSGIYGMLKIKNVQYDDRLSKPDASERGIKLGSSV